MVHMCLYLMQANDVPSLTRVVLRMIHICVENNSHTNYALLKQTLVLLNKRRGQSKKVLAEMVKKGMTYISDVADEAAKLELISTLRDVTDGKVCVCCWCCFLLRVLLPL